MPAFDSATNAHNFYLYYWYFFLFKLTLNIKFLAAWKGVWKQFVKSATGCAQCPGISVRNADYVQERSTQTPEDVSGTTENVVHMTTVLTTLL